MPGLGKSGISRISFLRSSQFCAAFGCMNLPDSFDAECGRLQQRRPGLTDIIDPRRARALLQLLAERAVLLTRARCHDLNIAIGAVAHPSRNADLRGFTLHKPAKADALDASGDYIAVSFEIGHKAVISN